MKLEITTKTLAIAGGIVVTLGGAIGGFHAYNAHKAAEEKKAAELAYANRPIVEEDCRMNGYGVGSCDFTNTGKTEGAICGVIQVSGPGIVNSSKFCSGMVQPMSTNKVDFNIPPVDKLCEDGFKDWRDVCDFTFIRDGLNGGDAVVS